MTDEFTGRTLSRKFALQRRIGVGGMATVYAAINTQIDKQVAVKVLRPEYFKHDTLALRFQREAKAAAQMVHPNIVHVLDYDVDDEIPYIVMEYLEGRTLSEVQHDIGQLPWRRVADVCAQVCAALEYAHGRGLLHRDIKPSNVFLVDDPGGRDIIKLLDFGIAKFSQAAPLAEPLTRPSQVPGTPEYMAPEQAQGEECEARTDLYSLGVMMYRLLTGRLPFYAATPTETLAQHVLRAPTPPSVLLPDLEVPPAFEAILLKALAKRPEQRWDSARAMRFALLKELDDPAESTQHHASRRSATQPRMSSYDLSAPMWNLQAYEWRERMLRWRRAAAMFSGAALCLGAFMFLSLFPLPGVATLAGQPQLPPDEEQVDAEVSPPPAPIVTSTPIRAPTKPTPAPPTEPTTTTTTPTPPSDDIIVDDTPVPPPPPRVQVPPPPRKVVETFLKRSRNSFKKCSEKIPFQQGATFTVDLDIEPSTGRALSATVEESLRTKDYATCALAVLQSLKYPRFVGDGQLKGILINL
jgi:tRNA A-37 threonylcarbamoyl transferase component Bud32